MMLRLALLALALPILGAAAPAQQSSAALRAELTTGSLETGGALQARLRSTEIGAPARLLFGPAAVNPLALPGGVLLVKYNQARVYSGQIGADGIFGVNVPLAPGLVMTGRQIAVQGGVLAANGQILLSWSSLLEGDVGRDATFQQATGGLPAASKTQVSGSVRAVDYDRDGDLDLTVATTPGPTGTAGGMQFFTNVGGSFVDQSAARLTPADNESCFAHEFADFDADGHQDLLILGREDANGATLEPVIFFNDGNGRFGGAFGRADLVTGLGAALDPAIGDVDADGDLDLVFCDGAQHNPSKGPHTLALLRNQGGAWMLDLGFQSAPFNNDLWTSSCVALGDLDNDGDLDLTVGRTSGIGGDDMLLINDGSGAYTDESSVRLPFYVDKTSDVKVADLNGDGWLDLLFAQSHVSSDPLTTGDLLYNQGPAQPGVFLDAPPAQWPETADAELLLRLWVETGDVDNDGDLDAVVMPHEFFQPLGTVGGYPGLFVNQGGAQGGALGTFFKDPDFFQLNGAPYADFICGGGALFDGDGDGDLEFYVSSQGGIFVPTNTQDRLLRNTLR